MIAIELKANIRIRIRILVIVIITACPRAATRSRTRPRTRMTPRPLPALDKAPLAQETEVAQVRWRKASALDKAPRVQEAGVEEVRSPGAVGHQQPDLQVGANVVPSAILPTLDRQLIRPAFASWHSFQHQCNPSLPGDRLASSSSGCCSSFPRLWSMMRSTPHGKRGPALSRATCIFATQMK